MFFSQYESEAKVIARDVRVVNAEGRARKLRDDRQDSVCVRQRKRERETESARLASGRRKRYIRRFKRRRSGQILASIHNTHNAIYMSIHIHTHCAR